MLILSSFEGLCRDNSCSNNAYLGYISVTIHALFYIKIRDIPCVDKLLYQQDFYQNKHNTTYK